METEEVLGFRGSTETASGVSECQARLSVGRDTVPTC